MAEASHTEVFHCTPKEFFAIIADFESYSEFLPEVKKCKVVEEKGKKKLVAFDVSLLKTFKYQMWMTLDEGKKISWELESGDVFKTSSGSWVLKDKKGKTEATYSVDATFKVFVPGPVAKALVNVNLPNMMSAYHKRVKKLYGG